MIVRRILRALRRLVLLLAALVVVIGAAGAYLWTTNPDPEPSRGWARLADMPDPRGEVASAVVGSRLVVAGGFRGIGATSDTVSVYEIERDEWGRGGPLPAPRHHAAAGALEGYVYVTGGAASALDATPRPEVWRSRPGGRWRTVEDMPEGRQGHAVVTWGGRLYVIGGVGSTDRTLVYHPEEGWSTAAPLPAPRDHLRAVAWGDEIWVVGGRRGDPTKRVDVYDPVVDRWRRGPDLPGPMSAMAVGVVGGELHVAGGEDPDLAGGVIESHFALGAGSRAWRRGTRPLLPVHGGGFGTYAERLYVAGGASRQGALSVLSWTRVTQVLSPG